MKKIEKVFNSHLKFKNPNLDTQMHLPISNTLLKATNSSLIKDKIIKIIDYHYN